MGPVHTGSESLGYEIGRQGTMTRYLEGSLNYNRLFGNHRVGALFLYNQKIHTNTQAADGNAALPYKNQGLAGRVTYAFRDTYFAEVNMGYNGSENLPADIASVSSRLLLWDGWYRTKNGLNRSPRPLIC